MQLVYGGGCETVTFNIDRKTKELNVTSSLTNYKPISKEWFFLFDKGKEKEQEEATDKLSDKLFIAAINMNMKKNGYTLLKAKFRDSK